jgi:V/A-type H+-transporting ATPase subunit F
LYKVGVIGDRDSVVGFRSLGLDVFAVYNFDEAAACIDTLAKEDYAVLFVTENMAEGIENVIAKYRDRVFPIITLIPSNQGVKGIGMQDLKRNVEKAVGADILFGKEG